MAGLCLRVGLGISDEEPLNFATKVLVLYHSLRRLILFYDVTRNIILAHVY